MLHTFCYLYLYIKFICTVMLGTIYLEICRGQYFGEIMNSNSPSKD